MSKGVNQLRPMIGGVSDVTRTGTFADRPLMSTVTLVSPCTGTRAPVYVKHRIDVGRNGGFWIFRQTERGIIEQPAPLSNSSSIGTPSIFASTENGESEASMRFETHACHTLILPIGALM